MKWLTYSLHVLGILSAMVTPGILRQSLAEALGLADQLEKIDVHLRNLREAGLITKAKTGRGAAEMGPKDAVNLLIAVAASELVKDSVESVSKYGSLTADPGSFSIHGGAELLQFDLPLVRLPDGHTFAEAACRILSLLSAESFYGDDLFRHLGGWRRAPDDPEYLFVRFFLPFKAVSVVYGVRNKFQISMLYGSLPVRDARASWDLRSLNADGRLLTVRVVDKVALTKIARAI
jgi:hypothetical protein